MSYLSKYLTVDEFSCNCEYPDCSKLPETNHYYYEHLFEAYDQIRERFGPLPVTSGWRCPEWNQHEGGSLLSAHQFGALDCNPPSKGNVEDDNDEIDRLYAMIMAVSPDLRVGRYYNAKTFIHIDPAYLIMPRVTDKWRRRARWTIR